MSEPFCPKDMECSDWSFKQLAVSRELDILSNGSLQANAFACFGTYISGVLINGDEIKNSVSCREIIAL